MLRLATSVLAMVALFCGFAQAQAVQCGKLVSTCKSKAGVTGDVLSCLKRAPAPLRSACEKTIVRYDQCVRSCRTDKGAQLCRSKCADVAASMSKAKGKSEKASVRRSSISNKDSKSRTVKRPRPRINKVRSKKSSAVKGKSTFKRVPKKSIDKVRQNKANSSNGGAKSKGLRDRRASSKIKRKLSRNQGASDKKEKRTTSKKAATSETGAGRSNLKKAKIRKIPRSKTVTKAGARNVPVHKNGKAKSAGSGGVGKVFKKQRPRIKKVKTDCRKDKSGKLICKRGPQMKKEEPVKRGGRPKK